MIVWSQRKRRFMYSEHVRTDVVVDSHRNPRFQAYPCRARTRSAYFPPLTQFSAPYPTTLPRISSALLAIQMIVVSGLTCF